MTAIEVQAPSTRPWWMENAGCQGKSQLFFPPQAKGQLLENDVRIVLEKFALSAKFLLTAKPMRQQRELGFWGGESEIERAEAGFAPTTPVIGLRRHRTAAS